MTIAKQTSRCWKPHVCDLGVAQADRTLMPLVKRFGSSTLPAVTSLLVVSNAELGFGFEQLVIALATF